MRSVRVSNSHFEIPRSLTARSRLQTPLGRVPIVGVNEFSKRPSREQTTIVAQESFPCGTHLAKRAGLVDDREQVQREGEESFPFILGLSALGKIAYPTLDGPGEMVGRGVPKLLTLGKPLQASLFQALRDSGNDVAGRLRGFVLYFEQHLQSIAPQKRRPTGENLIEDGAQPIDIGKGANQVQTSGRLLGRHVCRGPQHMTGQRRQRIGGLQVLRLHVHRLGRFRQADLLGQSPVDDHDLAEVPQDHVLALEVSMHDPLGIGKRHGVADDHERIE